MTAGDAPWADVAGEDVAGAEVSGDSVPTAGAAADGGLDGPMPEEGNAAVSVVDPVAGVAGGVPTPVASAAGVAEFVDGGEVAPSAAISSGAVSRASVLDEAIPAASPGGLLIVPAAVPAAALPEALSAARATMSACWVGWGLSQT